MLVEQYDLREEVRVEGCPTSVEEMARWQKEDLELGAVLEEVNRETVSCGDQVQIMGHTSTYRRAGPEKILYRVVEKRVFQGTEDIRDEAEPYKCVDRSQAFISCQLRKAYIHRTKVPLQENPRPECPLACLHVDLTELHRGEDEVYWLDEELMMRPQSRQRDGNPKSGSGAGPVSADHGENGLGGRRVQLKGTNFLLLFCLGHCSGNRWWRRAMDEIR